LKTSQWNINCVTMPIYKSISSTELQAYQL
jgi:hypothetical protein